MNRTINAARLAQLALSVSFGLFAAAAASEPLPRFATHVRTDITCDATPFGRHVTLGGEDEALDMIATSTTLNVFDEYQPALPTETPPLTRTIRAPLFPGDLAGTTFLKAVSIDLDGDGRVEIVAGAGDRAGSKVTVARGSGTPAQGTPATYDEFDAFPGLNGGVFVG